MKNRLYIILVVLVFGNYANAQLFGGYILPKQYWVWDNQITSKIDNGNGNWNLTEPNWTASAGSTNVLWTNGRPGVFGGNPGEAAAGIVNLQSNVIVSDLIFYPAVSGDFLITPEAAQTISSTTTDLSANVTVSTLSPTIKALLNPGTTNTLTKIGPGTLVLNGLNTYTGISNVNEGTLSLGDGVQAGYIIPGNNAANVASGATLRFNNPNDIALNGPLIYQRGAISGAGVLSKQGDGPLSFSIPGWGGSIGLHLGNGGVGICGAQGGRAGGERFGGGNAGSASNGANWYGSGSRFAGSAGAFIEYSINGQVVALRFFENASRNLPALPYDTVVRAWAVGMGGGGGQGRGGSPGGAGFANGGGGGGGGGVAYAQFLLPAGEGISATYTAAAGRMVISTSSNSVVITGNAGNAGTTGPYGGAGVGGAGGTWSVVGIVIASAGANGGRGADGVQSMRGGSGGGAGGTNAANCNTPGVAGNIAGINLRLTQAAVPSANKTYTGGTTISGGVFFYNSANDLGPSGTVTVAPGGTLWRNGFALPNIVSNTGGTVVP